jgi:hypothetical protein
MMVMTVNLPHIDVVNEFLYLRYVSSPCFPVLQLLRPQYF